MTYATMPAIASTTTITPTIRPTSSPVLLDAATVVADDDEYFRMAISALLRGPLGFTTVIETGSLDELKLNAE